MSVATQELTCWCRYKGCSRSVCTTSTCHVCDAIRLYFQLLVSNYSNAKMNVRQLRWKNAKKL